LTDTKPITKWSKIEGIDALAELALNLHWSWNHEADRIWERLDADMWRAMRDPWVILQTVSREEIRVLLENPEFRGRVEAIAAKNRDSYNAPAWFQKTHPDAAITAVAYFSMEFMLSEALPIYSGGLGNVAGDQMKAASDLGVPVVGVGLMYGQGYFRQDFDAKGRQQTLYPVNDPGQMPVRPLRSADGKWLRLRIELPGAAIWLRCWEVAVGRGRLYLLDANDFANSAAHRCITSELYGGDAEMRLKQEILLGIGGWRLLRAVGMNPEVCHLNEGHAAFAVLERARSYMEEHNCTFEVALNVTRAGNVFTTHTAVTAGFDRFDPELMRRYLGHYAQEALGISVDDLLALGRRNEADITEPFNMAFLAIRGACRVNGVSKLHGEVSREIFQPLFPRWPREEVPVGSVTNGVHIPTWESAGAHSLWTEACGKDRWLGNPPNSDDIRNVSDDRIWQMRNQGRARLIQYLRDRYSRQLAGQGMDPAEGRTIFDENILTVGFARRFATYKRPNLLLYDPERLTRLLNNPKRPMQLVIAGKAHPQDLPGQALIEQWNTFIKRAEVRSRVIFLSDYDMLLAKKLVQGIDLWTNTPRRPWEACGTSGMKVLSNGSLNLSELDGWWSEAYSPEVGWAMGDGAQHGNDSAWDVKEANDLYTLLEEQVVPDFYNRSETDVPTHWIARVRESMARLTPEFSASRTIRDYTEEYYLPAASAYRERDAENGALGRSITEWKADIAQRWPAVRFESVTVKELAFEGEGVSHPDGPQLEHPTGAEYHVRLFTGGIARESLRVDLYCPAGLGGGTELIPFEPRDNGSGQPEILSYALTIPGPRPASDYTVRVIPYHPAALVPIEADYILWQR
jgi:starch phosphorylase